MTDVLPVRRALLSVSDKSGLIEFARALTERGVTLVSSGTTASVLRADRVPVTLVSEVTRFPEMLEGRVKTLHPRIHGGILADKRKPAHLQELADQDIEPFDLVVVNLYPFAETVRAGASEDESIEQIDIGGPALIRAAAKNFESVAVVVSPQDYAPVLQEIERHQGLSRSTRRVLAERAFHHTRAYDEAIAAWFGGHGELAVPGQEGDGLPQRLTLALEQREALRYGENPHQRGGLYTTKGSPGPLGGAEVLQGK